MFPKTKDYVRLKDTTNSQMTDDADRRMSDGRDDLLNSAGRNLDRWWEYKDGKKTAVKVGTGLVIGAGVAAAGAATHGAAIPVAAIVGIAAGGYVAGKAADTTVGRMWDLGYTGASRTQAWVHDNGGHKDNSHLLEARAHKTIRHAVQHLRTAKEKFNKARQLPQLARMPVPKPGFHPTTIDCDDAFNGITALLHVKHHLEKVRLYLHPASFLLGRLLDMHEVLYTRWNGQDTTQLQTPWHQQEKCGSKRCYYTDEDGHLAGLGSYRRDWDDLGGVSLPQRRRKVNDLFTELSMGIGLEARLLRRLSPPTLRLIRDAESTYDESRDCFVHKKHGLTNWWDRKTHSEQVAFVARNAISAATAIGAGGAHVKVDEPLNALAALMDMGFNGLDLGVGETVEGVGLSSEGLRRDGKHAQEGIRHAAVHLWEALEVDHAIDQDHFGGNLRALTSNACERTADYLKNVNKIKHHLGKARADFWEMIELIDKLSKYTKRCLEAVNVLAFEYGAYLETFWTMHDRCQGRCYKGMISVQAHG